MDEYRVIITPRAGRDLEAIHRYIAQDSPVNATAMVTRIMDSLESLRRFPHRTVAERERPGLHHPVRSLPVSPYIVYFRVLDDERIVRILHVRHGARQRPRAL